MPSAAKIRKLAPAQGADMVGIAKVERFEGAPMADDGDAPEYTLPIESPAEGRGHKEAD